LKTSIGSIPISKRDVDELLSTRDEITYATYN